VCSCRGGYRVGGSVGKQPDSGWWRAWEPRGSPTPPPPSHRHPPRGAGSPPPGAEVERAAGDTWPTPPGLPARPIGGPDRGRSIKPTRSRHGRRPHHARRHLAGADRPGPPRGEPLARRCGHRSLGRLPRSWGPRHRLPLVALMPQWRQDYPNNPPPTRATAISEMGQQETPALQKNLRESCVRGRHSRR
jgi:hypothetical protein